MIEFMLVLVLGGFIGGCLVTHGIHTAWMSRIEKMFEKFLGKKDGAK